MNDDENSDTSAVEAKENIVDETETDIDVKAKTIKKQTTQKMAIWKRKLLLIA